MPKRPPSNAELHDQFLALVCERCGADRALELHHRRPRARGGTWLPGNLLTLCRDCHRWAHDHPRDAQRAGLLARSNEAERLGCVWCRWSPKLCGRCRSYYRTDSDAIEFVAKMYREGWSVEDIARILRLDLGTVRTWVRYYER